MQRFSPFELSELKLVYRILHRNLMSQPELMDAEFLEALQSWLQYRAGQDGVNLADHAQWDQWLDGTVISCEDRIADRRVIPLSLDSVPD
tara:strand:+ start:128 stop:397 length:270 start_codon:yes stop_codon:yes gene_type:complete